MTNENQDEKSAQKPTDVKVGDITPEKDAMGGKGKQHPSKATNLGGESGSARGGRGNQHQN